jgi:hypothetical protein
MNSYLLSQLRRQPGAPLITMAAAVHFHGPDATAAECGVIARQVGLWFDGDVDAVDRCRDACQNSGVAPPKNDGGNPGADDQAIADQLAAAVDALRMGRATRPFAARSANPGTGHP